MGFCASASGSSTIISGQEEALESVLKEKYGNSCGLGYEIDEIEGVYYIGIYDSGNYREEETREFLDLIAPYVSEGKLDYSGEEDSVWRFVFNPDTKSWEEETATVSYGFEAYTDEELIEELKRRGYTNIDKD